jgi:hypothetical protein
MFVIISTSYKLLKKIPKVWYIPKIVLSLHPKM